MKTGESIHGMLWVGISLCGDDKFIATMEGVPYR